MSSPSAHTAARSPTGTAAPSAPVGDPQKISPLALRNPGGRVDHKDKGSKGRDRTTEGAPEAPGSRAVKSEPNAEPKTEAKTDTHVEAKTKSEAAEAKPKDESKTSVSAEKVHVSETKSTQTKSPESKARDIKMEDAQSTRGAGIGLSVAKRANLEHIVRLLSDPLRVHQSVSPSLLSSLQRMSDADLQTLLLLNSRDLMTLARMPSDEQHMWLELTPQRLQSWGSAAHPTGMSVSGKSKVVPVVHVEPSAPPAPEDMKASASFVFEPQMSVQSARPILAVKSKVSPKPSAAQPKRYKVVVSPKSSSYESFAGAHTKSVSQSVSGSGSALQKSNVSDSFWENPGANYQSDEEWYQQANVEADADADADADSGSGPCDFQIPGAYSSASLSNPDASPTPVAAVVWKHNGGKQTRVSRSSAKPRTTLSKSRSNQRQRAPVEDEYEPLVPSHSKSLKTRPRVTDQTPRARTRTPTQTRTRTPTRTPIKDTRTSAKARTPKKESRSRTSGKAPRARASDKPPRPRTRTPTKDTRTSAKAPRTPKKDSRPRTSGKAIKESRPRTSGKVSRARASDKAPRARVSGKAARSRTSPQTRTFTVRTRSRQTGAPSEPRMSAASRAALRRSQARGRS